MDHSEQSFNWKIKSPITKSRFLHILQILIILSLQLFLERNTPNCEGGQPSQKTHFFKLGIIEVI